MRHSFSVITVCAGIINMLAAAAVLAVEHANIEAGPVYVTPSLEVEARYEDNLFRADKDEKSSWQSIVTPGVKAWMQNGANTYILDYKITDNTYASSHADDFTDHLVDLDVHHEFNAKNVAHLFGQYYNGHEERGTGLTEGNIAQLADEPVEYERTILGADYTFGSRYSKGRLKLAAKTENYSFGNFRDFTQFRDRDQDTYSGTFYWRLGAKTNLLLEARAISNDYDTVNNTNPFGSFDSDELIYQVGFKWDATGRTSGNIKLGMYDREYDSSFRKNDDGFSWDVGLTYQPRTYSNFDFATRRYSQETNGLGDFINIEEYTARWQHRWSGRSRTHLSLLYANDQYSGIGIRREDDRTEAEASYKFSVKRWFDMGLGYRYENRDSNGGSLSYSQNVVFIKAELSL